MPKPILAAEAVPIRVVIVTLDNHLAGAAGRARDALRADYPGLELAFHAAADWAASPDALDRCRDDIARGDIIAANMLFLEDHIQAVLPALQARAGECDAIVGSMSAPEVVRLTRLGGLDMSAPQSGLMMALKKLRGGASNNGAPKAGGKSQMAMLRRLPKLLRFLPGKAQDLRAFFLTMQYWLAGSETNFANMIRNLVDRYAAGPRAGLRGRVRVAPPVEYPEEGLYHPDCPGRIAEQVSALPAGRRAGKGTVGLLVMRSYLLAGDTAHYDGVIRALEAQGLDVIPAFASGLDARPAVEHFFIEQGRARVDAVISLTGFSLVGGPAYNDARAAEALLAKLDVPYLAAHPLEFQSLEDWRANTAGLTPVEASMMVTIPELDGATNPMVFGGRCADGEVCRGCARQCAFAPGHPRAMQVCAERAEMLAARTARLVALRRARLKERKIAVVLFNFPPNAGAAGTAANLSVFASLHNLLRAMKAEGYNVEVPDSIDALRAALLEGDPERLGTDANILARIPVADHVRRERYLKDIEAQWGPAPGRKDTDGRSIYVMGAQFGNVMVGLQPGFGYEGDPMRLLFEGGFAPTHSFSAFYRYLREDFAADAVLHFGTHGALEFMPGKQTGLSGECWSDRLIGDLPNFYLYCADNPSEGLIAKRRSAATLISYLTPPISKAGLYRGMTELKASLSDWRLLPPDATAARRDGLAELIQSQAGVLDLAAPEPVWTGAHVSEIEALRDQLTELEATLIPNGLHVLGEIPDDAAQRDLLSAIAEIERGAPPPDAALDALMETGQAASALSLLPAAQRAQWAPVFDRLAATKSGLAANRELESTLRAIGGRFVAPVAGGDLVRNPDILPTGRNLHGFDPFRLPSPWAVRDGAAQARRVIDRHVQDTGAVPETIALVLWGTDNLKTEGGPIAQALALIGARPRQDSFGRLSGAELIPLEELGRARIDVLMTLSGIFRDLLPLQTKMLAEAAYLAATADEPAELNPIRRHALAYAAAHGVDMETAALRVFSNADGAYGANVNQLIDSGMWDDENELADAYQTRKCYAFGRNGQPAKQDGLLGAILADVDMAYQNLDSIELGVTTIDHYFDTLGGIGRAVSRARGGAEAPVYIGDQTSGEGKVRSLSEQVALETRTRMLNPRWYEAMLRHGHEGVRNIEAHVTNTMGWSATTGQVDPWVYQKITETYVLDEAMRERLAALNPKASARLSERLIEAHERAYWRPDPETLAALQRAGEALEDRLEGVAPAAVKIA
ncbi:magnesium chelatase subunit H [Alkalicaulis satelles]|uniref:magnesium chelatase n=1 Tax=Alkalicaulis satelles TaxID=2609175 RepID=A0A5M6ZJW5_9PROT|nr:magnesium chelatase subunit H [Alkalicaulis satelles]KAA5804024.1 magnesium chelatase subunit H [Alkalicaulis satelles]